MPLVRLLVELERSGISLDDVAEVVSDGSLSLEHVDRAFIRSIGMQETTFPALAEQLGVSEEFARDVQIALGIPGGSDQRRVRDDDAEALRLLAGMVKLGIDKSTTARLAQIMADNMRRMARASSEMWASGVQQPLLDAGMSYRQILEAQSLNGDRLQMIGEKVVNLLWIRFLEDEIFSGTVEILEMALREVGIERDKVTRPPSIVFMDLTAFTHMTDREGDDAAATGAGDLIDVLRPATVTWGGTIVKMLGDGAMLHFSDPAAAVRCSLTLVDEIPATGLPPARFGVNAGPIIVRDVDYYGHTVNVAARLVDYARPAEVLVTADVAEAAGEEGLSFDEVGPVSLKGVTSPVLVYSARSG